MSSKKQNEKTLTAGEIRTYLLRALRLNESADKGVTMRFILANLLMTAEGYINIYLIKNITDALAEGKPLRATLIAVALMVGVCFMLYGIRVIIDRRRKCHELKRRQGLTDLLNNKAMEMDYVHLENPEMQTKFNRCKKSMLGSYSVFGVPDYLGHFIVNIFQVIASALLIFSYALTQTDKHGFGGFICSPWGFAAAALICFLFEMIKVFINDKANRIYEETQRDKGMIANERLYNEYLTHTIRHYQSGKDIRLYNEQEMILREVERTSKESIAIWKKAFVKFCSVDNFRQLASLMSLFTMYSYSILKALYGGLSAGEVIAFVMLFSSLSYSVTHVFDGFSFFRIAAVNAKEVADFLDIPDEKYKGTIPTEKRDDNEYEFEFKHVYFKYPGSEEYVLKDVNLKWRIGEKMALVGKNGCGKSTLVKLLCRLYDPTDGEITLNGIDIRKYSYEDYMALFSVVFQDSKLFSFSLAENVAADTEYDPERVESCVRRAGLSKRLDSMENGIETCLYKDFDDKGVEISGGEMQKICLARAIYKGAPFIVLDEPTAALDPISEYDIYTKFNGIVGTRTAIYISHRLSSCRFCDEITVMENGRIAERGSHDELLNKGGVYKKLWTAQAEYYKDTAGELFAY